MFICTGCDQHRAAGLCAGAGRAWGRMAGYPALQHRSLRQGHCSPDAGALCGEILAPATCYSNSNTQLSSCTGHECHPALLCAHSMWPGVQQGGAPQRVLQTSGQAAARDLSQAPRQSTICQDWVSTSGLGKQMHSADTVENSCRSCCRVLLQRWAHKWRA